MRKKVFAISLEKCYIYHCHRFCSEAKAAAKEIFIMKKRSFIAALAVALIFSLMLAACGGCSDDVQPIAVSWTGLTANGEENTADTTSLTLTFDKDPVTLSGIDITVAGATKGALTGMGNTRTLTVSDITVNEGETLTVTIADPAGYAISGSPQTVAVHKTVNASEPVAVLWTELSANGAANIIDTTILTLTFNKDPISLTATHITVTGAAKGALTGTGNTRTLAISDITVNEGETLTVTIADPAGYAISGNSKTVAVHKAAAMIAITYTAPTAQITADAWIKFECTTNGLHLFYSNNAYGEVGCASYASIYDSNSNLLDFGDYVNVMSNNFWIACNLVAGKTYYLRIGALGGFNGERCFVAVRYLSNVPDFKALFGMPDEFDYDGANYNEVKQMSIDF